MVAIGLDSITIDTFYNPKTFRCFLSLVADRKYAVLWAESLTNGFVQQGLMIDYPQNSYTDTIHTTESSGFYTVEVQLK